MMPKPDKGYRFFVESNNSSQQHDLYLDIKDDEGNFCTVSPFLTECGGAKLNKYVRFNQSGLESIDILQ